MANYTHEAINLGEGPGTGTGDPGRVGGEKINRNFATAFAALPSNLVVAGSVLQLVLNDGVILSVTLPAGGGGGSGDMAWKGDWNIATQYAEKEVVNWSGTSWIAVATPDVGDEPGVDLVDWEQLGGGGAGGELDNTTDRVVQATYTEPTSGVAVPVALRTGGDSEWQWVAVGDNKFLVGDSADAALMTERDLLDVNLTGSAGDAAMRLVGTGSVLENKLEPWRNANALEYAEWATAAIRTNSSVTVGDNFTVPDFGSDLYFGAEALLDSEGHWGGNLRNVGGTTVDVEDLTYSLSLASEFATAATAEAWAANAGKVLKVVDWDGTLKEVWTGEMVRYSYLIPGTDLHLSDTVLTRGVTTWTAPDDILVHRIILTRENEFAAPSGEFIIYGLNDGNPDYTHIGYTPVGDAAVFTAQIPWDETTNIKVVEGNLRAAGAKGTDNGGSIQQGGMPKNVMLRGDLLQWMSSMNGAAAIPSPVPNIRVTIEAQVLSAPFAFAPTP